MAVHGDANVLKLQVAVCSRIPDGQVLAKEFTKQLADLYFLA